MTPPMIEVEPMTGDAVRVRLPRRWSIYLAFRRAIRGAWPDAELWCWIVPGVLASRRVEAFAAGADEDLAREARLAAEARAEAEWRAAEKDG